MMRNEVTYAVYTLTEEHVQVYNKAGGYVYIVCDRFQRCNYRYASQFGNIDSTHDQVCMQSSNIDSTHDSYMFPCYRHLIKLIGHGPVRLVPILIFQHLLSFEPC